MAKRGRPRIHANGAAKQAAYRARDKEPNLIRQLGVELNRAGQTAAALGKVQGLEYIVSAIPLPRLLAASIHERERTQGIPAGEQMKVFTLAGAEVIHRALDLAVERAGGSGKPLSEDDQSKLVARLAGEVATFVGQVESRPDGTN